MKMAFLIRCLVILTLICFCFSLFGSWLVEFCSFHKMIESNTFRAAPLVFLSSAAFDLIYPLSMLALIGAVLPVRLIRFCIAVGIISLAIMVAHSLLPHSWRASPFPDPFYDTYWENSIKQANDDGSYERIVYDPNDGNQIIFYVKGFGMSNGDFIFNLLCFIPTVAFGVEIFTRRIIINKKKVV